MTRRYQTSTAARYDKTMRGRFEQAYYEGSDFFNYGYWTPETRSQREASANLIDKMLSMMDAGKGRILDVACGLGASTRHLLSYYAPADVLAINFSTPQLTRARENAPGANLLVMDASHLGLTDGSMENILCVEAAFHFKTRDDFYREAFRVLKPGGRLVTTDVIGPRWVWKDVPSNNLPTLAAFHERLSAAGFDSAVVQDVTRECWEGYCANLRRWPERERKAGRLGLAAFLQSSAVFLSWRLFYGLGLRQYVLTCARKPQASM